MTGYVSVLASCKLKLTQIMYPVITKTSEVYETRNTWQSLAYSPLGTTVSPPSKYSSKT